MNSMEQQAIHEKENTERHELANLRQTISNDLAVHRGVPIPSHMKTPGQDGYRTPTVEDYELHLRSTSQESQQVPIHDGSKLAAPPQERPTGRPRSPLTASFITLLPLLEKLHWKERLRHFTWSWFTLTMSTGGIANVLYNGTNQAPLDKALIPMLTPHSPLSISGLVCNRCGFLLTQRTFLCHHCFSNLASLLPISRDVQGLFRSSHRTTVHTGLCCLIRDYSDQCFSVWSRSHWTMADEGGCRAFLV